MNRVQITKLPGNVVWLRKICSVTGELYQVVTSYYQYNRWVSGTLAQDAFPELDADQREFIITGTTPAEWKEMHGDEEE